MEYIVLNGILIERAKARLDPQDGGFLRGDGAFETLRVERGCALDLDAHVQRLFRSLDCVGIPMRWSFDAVCEQVETFLEHAPAPPWLGRLRITVTRGANSEATIVVAADEYHSPSADAYARGVDVEVSKTLRRPHPLHSVKSTSRAANAWLRREASSSEVFEVVQFNDTGTLAEGSFTNVFVVDATGTLRTPAPEEGCLAGVTRATVLRLARDKGIPIQVGGIDGQILKNASEVCLTGSLIEILPVRRVDARSVGCDAPGPVTQALQLAYGADTQRFEPRQRLASGTQGSAPTTSSQE